MADSKKKPSFPPLRTKSGYIVPLVDLHRQKPDPTFTKVVTCDKCKRSHTVVVKREMPPVNEWPLYAVSLTPARQRVVYWYDGDTRKLTLSIGCQRIVLDKGVENAVAHFIKRNVEAQNRPYYTEVTKALVEWGMENMPLMASEPKPAKKPAKK